MKMLNIFRRGITINELIAAYLEWARMYYRKDGAVTPEVHCIVATLRRVGELYGNRRCDDFGPKALHTVVQRMVDEDLARKTINSNLSRIKRMFRWGVSQELIRPQFRMPLIASTDFATAGATRGRANRLDWCPTTW